VRPACPKPEPGTKTAAKAERSRVAIRLGRRVLCIDNDVMLAQRSRVAGLRMRAGIGA